MKPAWRNPTGAFISQRWSKVGRQIQTHMEFSGVPKGTTGRVISADAAGWAKPPYRQGEEAYDVAIQWDLPHESEPFADLVIPAGAESYIHIQTGKPLVDWFTKDEYEQYLDEVALDSTKRE